MVYVLTGSADRDRLDSFLLSHFSLCGDVSLFEHWMVRIGGNDPQVFKIALLQVVKYWLVVWNMFFHRLGIMIPIDSYFSEG